MEGIVWIYTFLSLITIALSTGSVTLEFIKGVTRLNNTGYTDYYFCCNVVGHFLQWQYDFQPLTIFQADDEVGRSSVDIRSGFEFTVTLLSSEPVENNNKAMDSIMVISFIGEVPSSFQMTCSNGLNTRTIFAGPVTNVTNTSVAIDTIGNNPEIILDYVSSGLIVRNTTTYIFICGTGYSSQLMQANRGTPLLFTSGDSLGVHRIASASTYKIAEQGIFVGKTPYIASILIVANNAGAEVSCFYQNGVIRLQSQLTVPPQNGDTTTTTTNDIINVSVLGTGTVPEVRQTEPTAESIYTVSTSMFTETTTSIPITRSSNAIYSIIGAIMVFLFLGFATAGIVIGVLFYKVIHMKDMSIIKPK